MKEDLYELLKNINERIEILEKENLGNSLTYGQKAENEIRIHELTSCVLGLQQVILDNLEINTLHDFNDDDRKILNEIPDEIKKSVLREHGYVPWASENHWVPKEWVTLHTKKLEYGGGTLDNAFRIVYKENY